MPLESILADITTLKSELDSYHPISNDRLQKINYKFRLEWNYHSNKMEGGTLTFEENPVPFYEMLGNLLIRSFDSYEEIQYFINELGSQITDIIEKQLFTD